jgi:hypothetical protein
MERETQRLPEETLMLKVCFTSTQEFAIHVISCFVTYLWVMILLQQTRGLLQCHSRNLVCQMIAMVRFYSQAGSFNLHCLYLVLRLPLFLAVKLRIKSFKVPELLVEIPESATVGSLKVCTGHLLIFYVQRDYIFF